MTDLVDDEQLWVHQAVDLAGQTVFGHGLGHATSQLDRRGEVDAVAHLGRQHAEGDGQVGLARARRAE